MYHIPVLVNEVLSFVPEGAQKIIDCTIGDGGHTEALLKKFPTARVLGIDADSEAIKTARKRLGGFGRQVVFARARFSKVEEAAVQHDFASADFLLADLGWSSTQFFTRGRGFSFEQGNEPLDMRFDTAAGISAAEFLARASEQEIGEVLRTLGEEKKWRSVGRAIVEERKSKPIQRVSDLVELIEKVKKKTNRLHPATLVFQALRVYVNDELGELAGLLNAALRVLKSGGRFAIISFQGSENKLLKEFARTHKQEAVLLTKKPVVPSRKEITGNSRARSAQLRVFRKF